MPKVYGHFTYNVEGYAMQSRTSDTKNACTEPVEVYREPQMFHWAMLLALGYKPCRFVGSIYVYLFLNLLNSRSWGLTFYGGYSVIPCGRGGIILTSSNNLPISSF